ncbi:mannose-6-phosphate isomerase, class I [Cryobacterium breve]|uniref:mannose-6-phosphate isomerase n=1 Tax=Cryobacterium breve TaxID=1259258 RepID=A0ABY7NAJ1_9MICO|nr:mannose-6-phosphate isomerase, class I [Cryobacterium breve]
MFVGISNTPRDYAWGSKTAIAGLLGTTPSGKPEAEIWLGAHPGSPSVIADPSRTGGAGTLVDWILADPERALGSALAAEETDAGTVPPRLPFLLKVLAAASPLSLQAHPTSERARTGFALENAAGIPVDAFDRNYRDRFHKPEIIFALSETFEALCGFRELGEVRRIVAEPARPRRRVGEPAARGPRRPGEQAPRRHRPARHRGLAAARRPRRRHRGSSLARRARGQPREGRRVPRRGRGRDPLPARTRDRARPRRCLPG